MALSLAVGLLGAWPQTAWAAELSDQPAVNATSSAQVVGPTGPTATTTTETANGQTTVVQSTIADLVNNGTYMNGGTYSVEG
ncbi:MAG: hypothetical protein FWF30_03165, partial [Coriobacteriia bacterium]|nr:hypothetical protein [Coriobacteriia bacterium]